MREVAIASAVLFGFAMLSVSVYFKENNFQTCLRALDNALPVEQGGESRELMLVSACSK